MSWSKGYDSQGNIFIFSVAPQILKAKEKMPLQMYKLEQILVKSFF